MKDENFIKLLEQVRKEVHRRLGKKLCSELHASCFDCKSRWFVGIINEWIDVLEPFKPKKK